MKKIFLLFAIFLIAFTSNAQSQSEMNKDAMNSYKKVDDELGVIYQVILKKYAKNTKFINALRASERCWIQYRDAEVKMMYPADDTRAAYGSIYPTLYYSYLEELTKTRLKELKLWSNPKQADIQGSIGDFNGEY